MLGEKIMVEMYQQGNRNLGLEAFELEERVDFTRLRKERLEKLQNKMKQHGIGGLLLYDPQNIRYATATHNWPLFDAVTYFRYALVPQNSDPVLFELPGVEFQRGKLFRPWVANKMKPSICHQYSGPAQEIMLKKWLGDIIKTLKDEGIYGEKLGVDKLDLHMQRALSGARIELVDAWPTIYEATMIKTRDELELLKQTATAVDAALHVIHENIRPGIRERDLAAMAEEELIRDGCEYVYVMIVSSSTNPYLRMTTDKPIRCGDLIVCDINVGGPNGYHNDYTRTFLCGSKATEEQKQLYKQCYADLMRPTNKIRAGVSTAEVAEAFPISEDDEFKTVSLMQFAHGIGIHHYEPPIISRAYSLDYPMKLQENMFLAVETYAAKRGGRQGVRLEENLIVTANGYELVSLYPHDEKLFQP
jgi:Xaa-Pro aminopeptidase